MTATATRPKGKTNALDELERLEGIEADLRAKANAASREHHGVLTHARGLHGQRESLAHREPGLVDHRGEVNPDVKDNPIKLVDRELANLPDLAELLAKYEHAKRLADRAQQDVQAHIDANIDELETLLDPTGQELAAATNEAVRVAADRADALVGHCQRLAGLAAAAHRNTRVRGQDDASALSRDLRRWSIAAPELDR